MTAKGDDSGRFTSVVWSDDLDELRVARDAGVDLGALTAPSGSLFGWAAEWGRSDIVELMLDAGVAPDPRALAMAAHKGHASTVQLLLERGMDPSRPDDFPPLCAAADRCSPACVRALLQAGADPDVRTGPTSGRWSNKSPEELARLGGGPRSQEVVDLLRGVG